MTTRMTKDGEIYIPYRSIQSHHAAYLTSLLNENKMVFPFRHKYMSSATELLNDMREGCTGATFVQNKQLPIMENGQTIGVINLSGVTLSTDDWCKEITDHYVEDIYIKSAVIGTYSPYNIWRCGTRNKDIAAESIKYAKLYKRNVGAEAMREGGIASLAGECIRIDPRLIGAVLLRYGATNVLDLYAKWGDRFVASVLAGVNNYTGVEVNSLLRTGHNQMISDMSTEGNGAEKQYRFIYADFLTAYKAADPPPDTIVFDPCSIMTETYFGGCERDTNGGIMLMKTTESNLNNWLTPVLNKAWSILGEGGHLIVHMDSTVDCISDHCVSVLNDKNIVEIISCNVDDEATYIYIWRKPGA